MIVLYSRDDLQGRLFFRYAVPDTLHADSSAVTAVPFRDAGELANERFYKKGVIYRGITVSGASGAGAVSGLDLELKGMISENTEMSAFISDNNTAVSENGATESLKDIDNIYIQFKNPNFISRMGNYDISYRSGEFGDLESAMTGAMLGLHNEAHSAEAYISSSGKKYRTVNFKGVEGLSGPYRIYGSERGYEEKVEPGSEKVWLNGKELESGEDYYFDHHNGELFFLAGTVVHEGDRITLDFRQFGDDYGSISYGFDAESSLSENRMKIGINYYSDTDLKEEARAFEMTDAIESSLASTDDASIWISGAEYNEGGGDYDLILPDSVYQYAGSGNGDYSVRFSYFGTGSGDYISSRDSTGAIYYVFVSPGGGEYLPLIRIEAPGSYSRIHASAGYENAGLTVRTEAVLSALNQNLYSGGSQSFDGLGDREEVSYSFGSERTGKFTLRLNRKAYNDKLVLPSRLDDVITEDMIDTESFAKGGGYLRYGAEIGHDYRKYTDSRFGFYYSEKGDAVETGSEIWTGLYSGGFLCEGEALLYEAENDSVKAVKKNYSLSSGYRGDVWNVIPFWKYSEEKEGSENTGSVRSSVRIGTGAGMTESGFSLNETLEAGRFDIDGETYLRRVSGVLKLNGRYGTVSSYEAAWSAVYSDYKDSSDTFSSSIGARTEFNSLNRYRVFAEYSAENTRIYKKARTYYEVEPGTGDFIYSEGEYFPDEFGNYSYYVTESEDPSDLTGVRLTINSFFDLPESEDKDNVLYWVTRFDVEQDLNIYERSSAENKAGIMLLDLSGFQGDSTVTGLIESRTSLYFLKNSNFRPQYSFLFRKELNREFLNYSESITAEEHDLALTAVRDKFTHRLSGRAGTYIRKNYSGYLSDDISRIYSGYMLKYKPFSGKTFSLGFEYGKEKENVRDIVSDSYRISPEVSADFLKKGIIRAGMDFISIVSRTELPYTMNSGSGEGTSYRWNVSADYRFAKDILGSLHYAGRMLSRDERPFHELRIEFRMEL